MSEETKNDVVETNSTQVGIENQTTKTKDTEKTLSDDANLNRKLKIIFILIIVGTLIWFIILRPMVTFKINENKFKKAAMEYFDIYAESLPTGERIGEVRLEKLYDLGILDDDFYVPYQVFNKSTCSVTDSWVKVKDDNGNLKYYTYLKCGILASTIDHKGPKISLNGNKEMTVSIGEKFEDPGVKSIKDASDGDISIDTIKTSGKVNTNKLGVYEIKYVASDTLNNESEVIRTVTVVQKLNETVKKETDKVGRYMGNPNNYIYFSGMLFRIVDIDGNNVRIVSNIDISNVNHNGIDAWLEYFYDNLADSSKKLIVKNKYCNMTININDSNATECSRYTKNINVYIPSITDVNKTDANGTNFLRPETLSWLAEKSGDKTAYITRDMVINPGLSDKYFEFDEDLNYGVRPILTIKGDTLIQRGNGTIESPYELDDIERAKADDMVNERYAGEYVSLNNQIWQIVKIENGETKIIYNGTLGTTSDFELINYETDSSGIYNTKEKDNIGFKINNYSSKYLDTKLLVKHEFIAPVYKEKSKYKEEIKNNKMTAKLAAPNMYELFSAMPRSNSTASFWYINSTKSNDVRYGVGDLGSALSGEMSNSIKLGIRPVAYLNKKCKVIKGSGTYEDPYEITK